MSEDRFRFRIWDEDAGCYCSEDTIRALGLELSHEGKIRFFNGISRSDSAIFEPEMCTGLRDKHGTLIYEGDVLGWSYPAGYSRALVGYGEFDNGLDYEDREAGIGFYIVEYSFFPSGIEREDLRALCLGRYPFNAYKWEVLGNIHESPELLANYELAKDSNPPSTPLPCPAVERSTISAGKDKD